MIHTGINVRNEVCVAENFLFVQSPAGGRHELSLCSQLQQKESSHMKSFLGVNRMSSVEEIKPAAVRVNHRPDESVWETLGGKKTAAFCRKHGSVSNFVQRN